MICYLLSTAPFLNAMRLYMLSKRMVKSDNIYHKEIICAYLKFSLLK